MYIKGLAIYICAAIVWSAMLFPARSMYQDALSPDQSQLGFPFKLQREENYGASSLWEATIVLPTEHYSQENLSQVFRWYMKRRPNREERLKVELYTEKSYQNVAAGSYPPGPRRPYDAIFYREGDIAHYVGGDNAWYEYRPNLSNPDEKRIVILKGALRFAAKEIFETWGASNGIFRVRVTSYELSSKHVTPKGVYYTFECNLIGVNHWSSIMSLRQDKRDAIPYGQVRFVNNKVGYVFMGWMYAATNDGGETWIRWDAERDLPNWKCCNPGLIRDVQIAPDGTGNMTLNLNSRRLEEVLRLHTKDYGRRWDME